MATHFSYADKCDKKPSSGIQTSCWDEYYKFSRTQESTKMIVNIVGGGGVVSES